MFRRFASALILASLSASAFAVDPLSYSFIEGQYLNSTETQETSSGKGPKDKTEGWRAAINVSLYKFIYFTGEADKRRASQYRFGTQSAGLGAHTDDRMTKLVQLFGDVTYERTVLNDVTNLFPDDANEGYGAEAGVRMPGSFYEFTAAYRYMDYGKTGTLKVTGGRMNAGAFLQLTPFFGLTADYRQIDIKNFDFRGTPVKDTHDEWTVGFRSYFATDIDRYRRRGGIFSSGE